MTASPRRSHFLHEPRTEQEVVCLFGALLDHIDPPVLIDKVQTPFPDCTGRRLDTGDPIRIEFELYGSHFIHHRHPHDACELLVCWRDDYGSWPANIQVVELADLVERHRPDLIATTDQRDPRSPWNERAFLERAQQDGTDPKDIELARTIIGLAKEAGLGPQWLSAAEAVFSVGGNAQFFKVWSNGRLTLPFSRLGAGDRFPPLASRLNEVVPRLALTPVDVATKSKGGRLSDLFASEQQLRGFVAVWTWYHGQGAA